MALTLLLAMGRGGAGAAGRAGEAKGHTRRPTGRAVVWIDLGRQQEPLEASGRRVLGSCGVDGSVPHPHPIRRLPFLSQDRLLNALQAWEAVLAATEQRGPVGRPLPAPFPEGTERPREQASCSDLTWSVSFGHTSWSRCPLACVLAPRCLLSLAGQAQTRGRQSIQGAAPSPPPPPL